MYFDKLTNCMALLTKYETKRSDLFLIFKLTEQTVFVGEKI